MVNPIEEGRGSYSESLLKKALGISAWQEAMQTKLGTDNYPGDIRPAWIRTMNIALEKGAPGYATVEFLMPTTSRLLFKGLDDPNRFAKYNPVVFSGLILTSLTVDAVLLGVATSMSFNNNNDNFVRDFGILKVNLNMGTHVALDLISAAAKRVRNFRPTNTTLAI